MLNDRNLQIQEVRVADASSRDTNSSGFVSNKRNANSSENDCSKTGNDQSSENKAAHLEMKAVGQRMNAMNEAILGIIRISDLPMTHNQWLRYHILLN
ncbi:hypothetical protein Tco_1228469 [Tanacetum coccineum]